MKRAILLTTPMLVLSVLAAGCGSSSTSASGGSTSQSAASTSGSGGGAYGGGYGSGASSAASTSGSPTATEISTKSSKDGTILSAGPKHLTVYLFEGDRGTGSSCAGACAAAWPPVTTGASPTSQGQAAAADLGTITRSGGSKQVTYKGHPLYYFVRDKDSGDAYGQGVKAFGAGWYVLAPNGQKIDNS